MRSRTCFAECLSAKVHPGCSQASHVMTYWFSLTNAVAKGFCFRMSLEKFGINPQGAVHSRGISCFINSNCMGWACSQERIVRNISSMRNIYYISPITIPSSFLYIEAAFRASRRIFVLKLPQKTAAGGRYWHLPQLDVDKEKHTFFLNKLNQGWIGMHFVIFKCTIRVSKKD